MGRSERKLCRRSGDKQGIFVSLLSWSWSGSSGGRGDARTSWWLWWKWRHIIITYAKSLLLITVLVFQLNNITRRTSISVTLVSSTWDVSFLRRNSLSREKRKWGTKTATKTSARDGLLSDINFRRHSLLFQLVNLRRSNFIWKKRSKTKALRKKSF